MQKHITAGERAGSVSVVIVTLDNHLASTVARAEETLRHEIQGLSLRLHAVSGWDADPAARERCLVDIASADIIIVTMLFMEDHIQSVLPALAARRDNCDAIVCCMSAGEVIKLTRIGQFRMDKPEGGVVALLKRLRGNSSKAGSEKSGAEKPASGARQMEMLKRLPKILRFIPGTAQDVRAYFLTLQYWLAGSDENITNLVRFLVGRYGAGPRALLKDKLSAALPADYPEIGVYHPDLAGGISARRSALPMRPAAAKGTVGLLVMRSYLLARNTAHYDGVIRAMEAQGLHVVPAFASGLDARPAIESFFMTGGKPCIDALVSLTGFSLVGGPAYNDKDAAAKVLGALDVPYIAAQAVEFQSLNEWECSDRGLTPVETTMMIAIPELDGATSPMLFGGRTESAGGKGTSDMTCHDERADALARRVAHLVSLRNTARAERKIGIVLFNFPPNAGSTGTAAFLAVYSSLFNTLRALADAGYSVDVPASVDELRERILGGNSARYGTTANVFARIPADDHVRRERHLAEIEAQWGPAPGRIQTDGGAILVLGQRFGNVFVGVQPAFGYEGDPMRLLFEKSFAPTHAFSAFYRYLREDFAADAVLHFGTHGALEFMPGKQTALSAACWPERLIGSLPNIYLYAANNPSEGTIAKRRSAATLVSYLTPPVATAGLYRGLLDLKSSLERWRGAPPEASEERARLAVSIQLDAAALELTAAAPAWGDGATAAIAKLNADVLELEYTLIPDGLHIVGEPASPEQRVELLLAMADGMANSCAAAQDRRVITAIVGGANPVDALAAAGLRGNEETLAVIARLADSERLLAADHELGGIVRALDGRYVPPAPSGDLVRNASILPTGRNIHGFDPFRIPSAFAVRDGAMQADRILARHKADTGTIPETIALVLWGTDNLKSEGGPIAQALALMGARPRFDAYGRLCGAALVPLAELGRPRIDVMMTLSGIFRDLLALQTKLLAEAAFLAATADEPLEMNFVRRHALAYQALHGTDLETAALRVFSNANSAYGSNVNLMIESGLWQDEDELAETYSKRKCFAYGRNGAPVAQPELLTSILKDVQLAYQNLESVELGITTVDHYFDTLGGIARAARRAGGEQVAVYIGDQTRGEGKVRSLAEQVALETRTRALNPRWYEGMLKHGYEGVRQIEAHVTNTMGWSATTGQVAPWVYQQLTETFVLDAAMRARLMALNPTASAKMASRLIEAHERNYWSPDAATLDALRAAGDEIEDRLEGVTSPDQPATSKPRFSPISNPSRQQSLVEAVA